MSDSLQRLNLFDAACSNTMRQKIECVSSGNIMCLPLRIFHVRVGTFVIQQTNSSDNGREYIY